RGISTVLRGAHQQVLPVATDGLSQEMVAGRNIALASGSALALEQQYSLCKCFRENGTIGGARALLELCECFFVRTPCPIVQAACRGCSALCRGGRSQYSRVLSGAMQERRQFGSNHLFGFENLSGRRSSGSDG